MALPVDTFVYTVAILRMAPGYNGKQVNYKTTTHIHESMNTISCSMEVQNMFENAEKAMRRIQ